MTVTQIILPLVLLVLLLISALCSATETAMFSLSQADRLRMRRTSPGPARAVATLLSQPRATLISILIANVTVNTGFFVGSSVLARDVERSLAGAGLLSSIIAAFVSLMLVVVFGEVIPKALASVHRVAFARLLAEPLLLWSREVSKPVGIAERLVVSPLIRVVRPPERETSSAVTGEDLRALLDSSARDGHLETGDESLLDEVIRLGERRVKEVMTPRVEIVTLDASGTSDDLIRVAGSTGFGLFPVSRGPLSEADAVGFVSASRALPKLARLATGARLPLMQLTEQARYVPELARLDQLLEHFRVTRSDAALCVSEVGALTGMVQLDDVIRLLVAVGGGEAGSAGAMCGVRELGGGSWEVPGRLPVREWEEFFAAEEMPTARVTTVAGLVAALLGRVPRVGDEVSVRNLRLMVESMTGRMVERVRVTVREESAAPSQVPEARP